MSHTKPPLRGTTVRCLEGIVRRLQDRIDEAHQEMMVVEAALHAARQREEELASDAHVRGRSHDEQTLQS